jgi:hypothetical protein
MAKLPTLPKFKDIGELEKLGFNPKALAQIEKQMGKGGGKAIAGAAGIGAGGLLASALGGGNEASSKSPIAGNSMLADAARQGGSKGTAGGGSLPSLKNYSKSNVNDNMSTNKLLVTAINYLAAIDSNLKNQIDMQRFTYTQDQQAQKEIAFETKAPEASPISGIAGKAGGVASNILSQLAKILGLGALMGAAPLIKWIKDHPEQAIATAGTALSLWLGKGKAFEGAKTIFTGAKAFIKTKMFGGAAEAAVKAEEGIVKAGSGVTKEVAAKTSERVLEKTITGATKTTYKFVTKQIEGISSKVLEKELAATGTKTLEKVAVKAISKTAIFSLIKKLPFIGAALGIYLAYQRAKTGDFIGAGGELLSGLLPFLGPAGMALAFGIDAALLAGDVAGYMNPSLQPQNRAIQRNESSTTGQTAGGFAKSSKNYVAPKQVYDYLKSKGVDDVHAKGMLANIQAESSFNAGAVGDGGTSGGLFQFHGPRFSGMKAVAGENWQNNWKGQVDYALSENVTKSYLKSSFLDAAAASKWFTMNFERPKDAGMRAQQRVDNLKNFSNMADPKLAARIGDAAVKTSVASIVPQSPKPSASTSSGGKGAVSQTPMHQTSGHRGTVPNPNNPDNSSSILKYHTGATH